MNFVPSALHFFWYNFSFVWWTYFNITCGLEVSVMNYFSFCLLGKKIFILLLIWKLFSLYIVFQVGSFFLHYFEMLFHWFLACIVSGKSLSTMSVFLWTYVFFFFFPLVALKIFSLGKSTIIYLEPWFYFLHVVFCLGIVDLEFMDS